MIRFLADADLNEGIVSGCLRREPAMDFLSANDAHLHGLPDLEVLRIAAEQNRQVGLGSWILDSGLGEGASEAADQTADVRRRRRARNGRQDLHVHGGRAS